MYGLTDHDLEEESFTISSQIGHTTSGLVVEEARWDGDDEQLQRLGFVFPFTDILHFYSCFSQMCPKAGKKLAKRTQIKMKIKL